MGLLSSLFGGEKKKENNQQENKNFDILKYDGIRARNIRQLPYAIKCFEEAIALKEDAETMELLAASYIQTGKTDEARVIYNRLTEIEPESTKVLLSLAGVCFMQEDYAAMKEACQKAIALDNKNKTAFYLASKAEVGEKNYIQAIVMLTKAIAIDEDFKEAYQLRAEVLWNMRQPKEALDDIKSILSKDSTRNNPDLKAIPIKGISECMHASLLFLKGKRQSILAEKLLEMMKTYAQEVHISEEKANSIHEKQSI